MNDRSRQFDEPADDFEARVRVHLREGSRVASGDLAALEMFARRMPERHSRRGGGWSFRRWPTLAAAAAILVATGTIGALVAGPLLLTTPSPTPSMRRPSPEPTPPEGRCVGAGEMGSIDWFVGLGGGTLPTQIEAERKFVAANNARNCLPIKLDIVPNATAYDVLKTRIAAGNPPDIIGPLGAKAADGFDGLFLDLRDEIKQQKFDLSDYEPAVLGALQENGAQIGLPYTIYPGYILYGKKAFADAGLPPLPTKVGETYQGKTWDWNTLAEVATGLRSLTQPGFDRQSTYRKGFGLPWASARRFASCFGGGSFVASDGVTAQIPNAWRDAYNWLHDGFSKDSYAYPGSWGYTLQLGSPGYEGVINGRSAMEVSWPWAISSYGSEGRSGPQDWDIAVMPSWNGTTSSPMDADSFQIPIGSRKSRVAFEAMTAIMADPALLAAYGGMPARKSAQEAWFATQDLVVAASFPGNTVNWSVLQEMSKYPALPNHEALLPNDAQSVKDAEAFFEKLQTRVRLDINAELGKLQATLQKDFDVVRPL
jgi:multiple sugar transport system substrate-binding protein